MNYQNKELIKKLYLLRINMIMYHTFYGMLCMNFQYYFDEHIDNFEVEDLKIKANPNIVNSKSIPELEVMMVDKVCKYLDKLKVYDIDYDVNDIGELDNSELDEIEREYEESNHNINYDSSENKDSGERNEINRNNENLENDVYRQEENNENVNESAEERKKEDGGCQKEQGKLRKSGSGDISKNSSVKKSIDELNNYETLSKTNNCNNNEKLQETTKGQKINGGSKESKSKFHEKRMLRKYLQRKVYNVVKIMKERNQCGYAPLGAEVLVKDIDKKEVNWREELREFLQFDVNDYSFMPPDRRYDDSPFYLPDYNDEIEKVENILFMIDDSGSMSDKTVSMVFNEIKNCVDEFSGKVKAYVGSFDDKVYNVVEFEDKEELDKYSIKGRGGTSFINVFNYINEKMRDIDLKAVIILTDGYAPYPDEVHTRGMPILWVITNKVSNPTCGKVVRICDKKI